MSTSRDCKYSWVGNNSRVINSVLGPSFLFPQLLKSHRKSKQPVSFQQHNSSQPFRMQCYAAVLSTPNQNSTTLVNLNHLVCFVTFPPNQPKFAKVLDSHHLVTFSFNFPPQIPSLNCPVVHNRCSICHRFPSFPLCYHPVNALFFFSVIVLINSFNDTCFLF